MKSLLLTPALVAFVNAEHPAELSFQAESLSELVAITQVVERRPLVELLAPPPPPLLVVEKDDERVRALQADLEKLGATLQETQKAVGDVGQQRDEAREEVRALAKANHEILNEMKAFRAELEVARGESEKWKEHAASMERKANDQALANAALQQFRAELEGTMKDFQTMKGDIAQAREILADPIERANLKEELAASKANQERLGAEIEMALIAREKTIQETAQARKEMEDKIAVLTQEAQEGKELRDELRGANAVKMKALADVEVLRKALTDAETGRDEAVAKLDTAQHGLTALQAEKAAAMEAKSVATQERDVAQAGQEDLRKQVEAALGNLENTSNALAETNGRLKVAQQARIAANQQRDAAEKSLVALQEKMNQTQSELENAKKMAEEAAVIAKTADQKLADLDKTKEEVVFLNKAKGGLEELLFKKTAEIRQLKGELRKVQASQDESSKPPTPVQEAEEGKDERTTAQALAD